MVKATVLGWKKNDYGAYLRYIPIVHHQASFANYLKHFTYFPTATQSRS